MAERRMVKMALYLFRECGRTHQEGLIKMLEPNVPTKDARFKYLDEIPAKIRRHLEMVGLAYDVADNSDDTVITPKVRKRRVIRKIRLGDE